MLLAGFFDIVDGQVARVSKKITKSGGFLDSVFDKIAEVAIFLGILVGGFAEPYLVFLAITFSLLVSYTRSRAESLGVKLQGIGIGERAERLLVIAIIGILAFMEYAVIIVIIIAGITFIQRIVVTANNNTASNLTFILIFAEGGRKKSSVKVMATANTIRSGRSIRPCPITIPAMIAHATVPFGLKDLVTRIPMISTKEKTTGART